MCRCMQSGFRWGPGNGVQFYCGGPGLYSVVKLQPVLVFRSVMFIEENGEDLEDHWADYLG